MIKKLLLSLIISLPFFITAQDNPATEQTPKLTNQQLFKIAQQVDSWISKQVITLPAQDILALTNFLYLSHAFNQLDAAARHDAQITAALLVLVRARMEDGQLAQQAFAYHQDLTQLLDQRAHVGTVWQQCLQYMEQHHTPEFQKTVETFQLLTQQGLKIFMAGQDAPLTKTIQEASAVLVENSATVVQQIADVCKDISQGKFPVEGVIAQEEQGLYKLHFAHEATNQLDNSTFNNMQVASAIGGYVNVLQDVTNQIFSLVYTKLLALLKQKNVQPHLMFSTDGFVAAEQREHLLPENVLAANPMVNDITV